MNDQVSQKEINEFQSKCQAEAKKKIERPLFCVVFISNDLNDHIGRMNS